MNIKTEHVYPPIPHRGNDWCAWIDGSDEETRICGWGETEEAAIADLKMILEDEDDAYHHSCSPSEEYQRVARMRKEMREKMKEDQWLEDEMKSQELWD